MSSFFSMFKKPTQGIIINKTQFDVFYLIHYQLLSTGSIETSTEYGGDLQISKIPSLSVSGHSNCQIKQSFQRMKGGTICGAKSRNFQGLTNIKKDGSSYITVYFMKDTKIIFLCKNVLIKSNVDVRLKIRFDKQGRLGCRSMRSKEYHKQMNEYEPTIYGDQPEDFDLESFHGFEEPDSD